MTTAAAVNEIKRGLASVSTTPQKSSLRSWNAGLFLSAIFAVVSGIAGLAIAVLAMGSVIAPSTNLYTVGTVLIGASFILFGLAAHCLDKAHDADKAMRIEYCRRHGLKDDDRLP
jgi:hypothetical protein